jgi:hypothetical protein
MHWGLVLLLSVVTVGIFYIVWMAMQANWAKKVQGDPKALNLTLAYVGVTVVAMGLSFVTTNSGLAAILRLAQLVVYLMALFALRTQLQLPPINLSLNGVMTFFFGAIYFQSHLSGYNAGYSGTGQPQYGQYQQPQYQQPQQFQPPPQQFQPPPQQWAQPPAAPQGQPGAWPQPAAPQQPAQWTQPPAQPGGWPPQQ